MHLRDSQSKVGENMNIPQLLPQRKDSVVRLRASQSKALALGLGSLIPLVPHPLSAIQSSWFLDSMRSILHQLDNLETMSVLTQKTLSPRLSRFTLWRPQTGVLGSCSSPTSHLAIFGTSENLTLEGAQRHSIVELVFG